MRVPTDALTLTWDAVNFAESHIVVTSPKVEKNAGGGKRVIAITEDFRQYFEDVLELNGTDTHVFPLELRQRIMGKRGARGANFREGLSHIAKRVGIVFWGKPFQNLRSSYESDLAKRLPLALAAKLTGNSSMTAMRHYIDVTDETFETAKAIRLVDAKPSESALLNALLSVPETPRNGKNDTTAVSVKSLEKPGFAAHCRVSQQASLPWVYPSSLKPLNSRGLATSSSAECEEVCEVLAPPLEPRLRAMLAHWDALPESLRESLFRQLSEAVVLQSVTHESVHSV